MRTHFKDNFQGFLVALKASEMRKPGKAIEMPAGGGDAALAGAPAAKRARTYLLPLGRAFIDAYLDSYIGLKGNSVGRAALCEGWRSKLPARPSPHAPWIPTTLRTHWRPRIKDILQMATVDTQGLGSLAWTEKIVRDRLHNQENERRSKAKAADAADAAAADAAAPAPVPAAAAP